MSTDLTPTPPSPPFRVRRDVGPGGCHSSLDFVTTGPSRRRSRRWLPGPDTWGVTSGDPKSMKNRTSIERSYASNFSYIGYPRLYYYRWTSPSLWRRWNGPYWCYARQSNNEKWFWTSARPGTPEGTQKDGTPGGIWTRVPCRR